MHADSRIGRSRRTGLTLVLYSFAFAAAVGACDEGGTPTPSPTPIDQVSPGPSSSPLNAEQVIDLANQAAATVVWGADKGDFLNDLPLLTSGDVNGDGLSDLLIGARFGDGPQNARTDSGEAYLIFGSEDLPEAIDLAEGKADVTIYGRTGKSAGSANGDQLGYSGLLADVNGDGIDDVVLGAPFAPRESSGAEVGAVYVFFGDSDWDDELDLAEAEADVTLLGADGSGFFGDSMAASDVTNDGITDLIVGATFSAGQRGAAYIIKGGSELAGTRDMSAGDYDAAVFGADVFDELGDNVAAGDVNGDGIGDIILTAEAADGPDEARQVAAEVYIIYGSAELAGTLEISAGEQDVTIYGAEQNDTIGFNLTIGDVDGDGVDDLLLVARLADGPDNSVSEAGEVHIILGDSALPEAIDLAAGDSHAYLFGTDPADQLGASLAAADVDGDGAEEILCGTGFGDGPDNGRSDGGEVYVLDGANLTGGVNVAKTHLNTVVFGARAGDRLGAATAAADLDGDGALELIMLASEGDGPDGAREDAGQLYILTPVP